MNLAGCAVVTCVPTTWLAGSAAPRDRLLPSPFTWRPFSRLLPLLTLPVTLLSSEHDGMDSILNPKPNSWRITSQAASTFCPRCSTR